MGLSLLVVVLLLLRSPSLLRALFLLCEFCDARPPFVAPAADWGAKNEVIKRLGSLRVLSVGGAAREEAPRDGASLGGNFCFLAFRDEFMVAHAIPTMLLLLSVFNRLVSMDETNQGAFRAVKGKLAASNAQ